MNHLIAAATLALTVLAPAAADAETRFFLFVSHDVASQGLIDAALREAQTVGPPAAPEASRKQFEQVFPKLFDAAPSVERGAISDALKAGTAAHYATNFDQAEVDFARAFELAYSNPELLDGSLVIIKRLADGAALRYANATVASKDVPDARRQFREFVRRFPAAEPTRTEHPPRVMKVWEALRREVMADTGDVTVHAEPLDLERSGNCQLLVGGAELGRLPLSRPVALPTGPHLVQVRCGLQHSWVQRVLVADEPLTIRVPVRAMLSARAESRSGGIVLTRPAEGDTGALVTAITEAAGFDGAVVVQTAVSSVYIGRWERGAAAPAISLEGDLEQDNITSVGSYSSTPAGGDGRVWTWVVGGLGAAAVIGGVVANVAYVDRQEPHIPDDGTQTGLRGAATALYVTGGVLLATSVILYFVEAPDDGDNDGIALRPSPGGIRVAF